MADCPFQSYLYLSCTFCLMSTKLAAQISLSRYSDKVSVACSKSLWLSCKVFKVVIWAIFKHGMCEIVKLPQRFHIGCFSANSRQRRKCTSKSADTRTRCPRPFSKTALRSKTCCVAASHPSSPSPWCTTCSRTLTTASDSCIDCNKKGNASGLLEISLGLRGHFWLHLRHTYKRKIKLTVFG